MGTCFSNESLNRDYSNFAAMTKSLMRLCAFAMVGNGTMDDSESIIIANVIVRRYLGRNMQELSELALKLEILPELYKDAAPAEEIRPELITLMKNNAPEMSEDAIVSELAAKLACAKQIVSKLDDMLKDSDTRKSIFMNLDSLDEGRLKIELFDTMLIARADLSLLDSEREAFRVFCKAVRIVHSSSLWQKLTQCKEEELWRVVPLDIKIVQKKELDVNDYRSIKKSIEFYDIRGPFVASTYYQLQREQVRHRDITYHSDKVISKYSFVIFCFTALLTYLKISYPDLLDFANPVKEICIYLASHLGQWAIPFYATLILGVSAIGFYMLKKIRRKRNVRSFAMTNSMCMAALLVFGYISLYSNQVCLLMMMISIEWLIFMKEQLQGTHAKNHSIMVIMVAAAIITDVSLGIIEHYHHSASTPNFILIIASAFFLGCICFFFGKWLENRRLQNLKEQEDMEQYVESISARIVEL